MTLEWRSLHVAYHGDQDTLLLDAVRPLLDRLGDTAGPAYWIRHWRRGPHVRVNLYAAPGAWADRIEPAVKEIVGGHLAAHPSTTVLDENAEAARHRLLADAEFEDGPLHPWYPDNSYRWMPYDDRRHVLRTPESAELLVSFQDDTGPLVFSILDAVRQGANKLTLAADLFFAHAQIALPGGITRGFRSYRAHADVFLAGCPDPDAMRAAFDRRYRQHSEVLAARLAAVLETLDGRGFVPFVADWSDVAHRYRARAAPLIADGRVPSDPARPRPPRHAPYRMAPLPDPLAADRYHLSEVVETDWFAGHRLLIDYLYLLVGRLGIGPHDRCLLCHLVASTVEEVHGTPATGALLQAYPDRGEMNAAETA
jgi:hypothetical protein